MEFCKEGVYDTIISLLRVKVENCLKREAIENMKVSSDGHT